jgi:hypothetical protein
MQPHLLASAMPALLPLVLAAVDDPSYAVQRSAHLALQHCATAVPQALAAQRALLLDTSRRLAIGCAESAAETAFPAAVSVVLVRDGTCAGCWSQLQSTCAWGRRVG